MRFSDQLEQRFAEMITHYPTKRAVLVPILLYVQDELGAITDDAIHEVAQRVELSDLEVRNVISYYSMMRTHPIGKYNLQVCTNVSCLLRGADDIFRTLQEEAGHREQGRHARRSVPSGRGRVHRRVLVGSGDADGLRLSREPDAEKIDEIDRRILEEGTAMNALG